MNQRKQWFYLQTTNVCAPLTHAMHLLLGSGRRSFRQWFSVLSFVSPPTYLRLNVALVRYRDRFPLVAVDRVGAFFSGCDEPETLS